MMPSSTARARRAAVALAMILAPATGALAADPPKRAQALQQLLDCRGVTESAARLACFDQAAGRFDEAEKAGQVVVVDRAQMREVRRQAFGFTLPSLAMFDRGGRTAEEDIDEMTATVARARQDPLKRWVITLEGGAVWRQTEDGQLLRDPKAGSKVRIKRRALGSYFMNVDEQRAIKVERTK